MALLLETTIGDLVIDLDTEGSPALCKNVLKLAKARYYTGTLIYNVQPHRFCQLGDPRGDGKGGACIYGLLDGKEDASSKRFLKSSMGRELTRDECLQKGRVVATEMNGIPDTIGSQLLITIDEGEDRGLDGFQDNSAENLPQTFRSVGQVVEDEKNVLGKLNASYCDAHGRPYADIRVVRALVIDDPYEDPPGMDRLLEKRGVVMREQRVTASPDRERPLEEIVETRISANEVQIGEEDQEKMRLQEEERLQREAKSRAVVLEMLGDLPSADIKAPENVLFVCKLNPVTEDEDLELIFSRFDEKVSVEIVRDHQTGASLQYAFAEFTTKEQAAEAYFKMNNALVDDRRIKVDFSQSVSKIWDRFHQRARIGMPKDPLGTMGKSPRVQNHGGRHNPNHRQRRDYETSHRNDRYYQSEDRGRSHRKERPLHHDRRSRDFDERRKRKDESSSSFHRNRRETSEDSYRSSGHRHKRRSRSRSEDRERKHSSRKKSRRKRDRRSDDERKDRKRDKRRHHRSNRHRRSPSSSRS